MFYRLFLVVSLFKNSILIKKLKKIIFLLSAFFVSIMIILINYIDRGKTNNQILSRIEITDVLKGDFTQELRKNLQIQKDINQNLEFIDIRNLEKEQNPFTYVKNNIVSLGFVSNPVWFKISLVNKTKEELTLILLSWYPLLDFIECYIVNEKSFYPKPILKGDRYHHNNENNLFNNNSFFLIKMIPGEKSDIYIKIKTESTLIAIPQFRA